MAIGLIIIGDEILSGKRVDKHFSKAVELLSARGMQLGWAEYLGDDPARITATLRRTLASDDIVFSGLWFQHYVLEALQRQRLRLVQGASHAELPAGR